HVLREPAVEDEGEAVVRGARRPLEPEDVVPGGVGARGAALRAHQRQGARPPLIAPPGGPVRKGGGGGRGEGPPRGQGCPRRGRARAATRRPHAVPEPLLAVGYPARLHAPRPARARLPARR